MPAAAPASAPAQLGVLIGDCDFIIPGAPARSRSASACCRWIDCSCGANWFIDNMARAMSRLPCIGSAPGAAAPGAGGVGVVVPGAAPGVAPGAPGAALAPGGGAKLDCTPKNGRTRWPNVGCCTGGGVPGAPGGVTGGWVGSPV